MLPSMRLDEKVVVVTGAGAGIGRAIAIAYAEAGAERVVMSGDGGKITNIASQYGVVGYYKHAAYWSSRAGVAGLTRFWHWNGTSTTST